MVDTPPVSVGVTIRGQPVDEPTLRIVDQSLATAQCTRPVAGDIAPAIVSCFDDAPRDGTIDFSEARKGSPTAAYDNLSFVLHKFGLGGATPFDMIHSFGELEHILHDHRATRAGQTILFIIGASWCPPCRSLIQRIADGAVAPHRSYRIVYYSGGFQRWPVPGSEDVRMRRNFPGDDIPDAFFLTAHQRVPRAGESVVEQYDVTPVLNPFEPHHSERLIGVTGRQERAAVYWKIARTYFATDGNTTLGALQYLGLRGDADADQWLGDLRDGQPTPVARSIVADALEQVYARRRVVMELSELRPKLWSLSTEAKLAALERLIMLVRDPVSRRDVAQLVRPLLAIDDPNIAAKVIQLAGPTVVDHPAYVDAVLQSGDASRMVEVLLSLQNRAEVVARHRERLYALLDRPRHEMVTRAVITLVTQHPDAHTAFRLRAMWGFLPPVLQPVVLRALGQLQDPIAYARACDLTKDADPERRLMAVVVLENFRTPDVLPVLEPLLADADGAVREAARAAIAKVQAPRMQP